jgi:hypothetical protein
MTLKCKIKEVTELKTELDLQKYRDETLKNQNEPSDDDEDLVDEEEFTMEVLGTIEEVSYRQAQTEKRARERKKSFYDRNSIS